MTKAYSLHGLRSVGICYKSESNTRTAKKGSMYSVLTWSDFRPNMHQVFYGKWWLYNIWITFSYSCRRYHKNTQQLWQNKHRAKVYFMCLKSLWWLITVPNMNKGHWFISDISLQTYKCYDRMDILLHCGTQLRYILHALSLYCDGLLHQIWATSTYSFLRYCNKHKI